MNFMMLSFAVCFEEVEDDPFFTLSHDETFDTSQFALHNCNCVAFAKIHWQQLAVWIWFCFNCLPERAKFLQQRL